MKTLGLVITLLAFSMVAEAASDDQKTYRWVDKNGVVHFGDLVPPEYADQDKQILNEQGVHVGLVRGKKTAEELAEEARQERLEEEREKKRRADMALLATYLSVEEIEMHRDRRIELLGAQNKVTDLYLRNLARRLQWLNEDASEFRPYSPDPDAPPVPVELTEDIDDTRKRIDRYKKLRAENQQQKDLVAARFEHDIQRFKKLKRETG